MASSQVLSQTLSSITTIKLEQLKKQKDAFELGKRALLDDAAYETDNRKRARLLIERSEDIPAMTPLRSNGLISIENFKRFIDQAEHDPSLSDHFLQDYEDTLRNELHVQSNKYNFATLYGKLVDEWISLGKSEDAGSETGSGFVPVGREEMHEQRAIWEEYVFKAKDTDKAKIKTYLDDIFIDSSKDVKGALESLREDMETFQKSWDLQTHFDEGSLSNTIKGMLRCDTLSDEKRASLRDFQKNSVVLSEIADVLNMRMSTWKTWAWEEALVIEQRRNLNGRYRFYPDEDLLQAMFLHYIGLRWSVQMRQLLVRFINLPGVWKPNAKPISAADKRRRDYFLQSSSWERGDSGEPTVEEKKQAHFQGEIFLDQLAASMTEQRGSYGDDSPPQDEDTRKSHIDVVQKLLHMIETDILLHTRLGEEVTVIRSDYKWFGPSIPHSSIYAVLAYFGARDEWIDFFGRVLEAPLRFKQDPADAPAQIRRRGTPLSTPFADFVGELLLFCSDFAVNQKANGARLYRLHDDMWLWGDTDSCVRSWRALSDFADVVGLDFNLEKTGSARISRGGGGGGDNGGGGGRTLPATTAAGAGASGLPQGRVTWGFLKLDGETGRFVIDQDEVDKHIAELRLQLDACRTVFDWTQAWNMYGSRFFATNFGRPANCYSRAHVDAALDTFRRIQRELFPGVAGGVGEHLKAMIAARSQGGVGGGGGLTADDIPDGYLYFPLALGGLGLQNPFITLHLIRDDVVEDPDRIVTEFLEREETQYRRARDAFESEDRTHHVSLDADLRDQPFMSFEEYTRYRERTSTPMATAFDRLMHEPLARDVELKGGAKAALDTPEWTALTSYEKWVVQLFHKDMISRFGGLNIVDKGLLPMGLMSMLRQSRFKWQG